MVSSVFGGCVMVWGIIVFSSQSPLVHIEDSSRYISGVLRPVSLPCIRALRNLTFQQDNARPHDSVFVRTFLDTENVRLLPWPARSSNLSPLKNTWTIVASPSLRLMSWGIVLKLHGHLYFYMPSNLCLTQYPGV
ncbi:transposable element Tcb1 transposase [Trichonephila clavipes]|nr:transposable element Tcb1 transposase [Trichonephila clavipes]